MYSNKQVEKREEPNKKPLKRHLRTLITWRRKGQGVD